MENKNDASRAPETETKDAASPDMSRVVSIYYEDGKVVKREGPQLVDRLPYSFLDAWLDAACQLAERKRERENQAESPPE